MKNVPNFRVRVMKYAHQLFITINATWSECLRRAWSLIRLINRMKEGSTPFCYRKKDGSIRQAYGTLRVSDLSLSHGSREKKPCWSAVSYFDLSKWQWRSFASRTF